MSLEGVNVQGRGFCLVTVLVVSKFNLIMISRFLHRCLVQRGLHFV